MKKIERKNSSHRTIVFFSRRAFISHLFYYLFFLSHGAAAKSNTYARHIQAPQQIDTLSNRFKVDLFYFAAAKRMCLSLQFHIIY